MKPSRYTIELQIDGEMYLYNSLSNAYAKLDAKHYETYFFIKNGIENYDKEVAEELYKGGFVINDDEDELEYMHFMDEKLRNDSNTLGLTIASTLQCNFRCIY